MKKFIADANIGLRMLVGSKDIHAAKTDEARLKIHELVQYTKQLFQLVDAGKITVVFPDAVIEEMVFTLKGYYGLQREEISKKILLLIEADNVEASALIRETIREYGTVKLDVVDIKLSLLSKEMDTPILTWDEGFVLLTQCEYYSPRDVIHAAETDDETD